MRSAVQSCVPLQESTAKRCVFFVYGRQAAPKGLDIGIYALKACFQSDRNDDGQSGSAATGPDDIHTKISQRFPKQLSWVPCDRTERIRRSPIGRLKHPASRYLKIKHLRKFRKCFFDAREHRVNTKSFYFIKFSLFPQVAYRAF